MNKQELIAQIAAQADISKVAAAKVVDAFTDSVTAALKKGDSVTLIGFGTFKVNARAARIGRNPRTGESLKIKATKVPAFKAGTKLKAALNGGKK